MAIDLFGHSALSRIETPKRIVRARAEHPEWFDGPLMLADAKKLGPFGAEIAQEFGIEAKCQFGLFLHENEKSELITPAAEYLYELFGTDNVVITHGMDTVWKPKAEHPGVDLD